MRVVYAVSVSRSRASISLGTAHSESICLSIKMAYAYRRVDIAVLCKLWISGRSIDHAHIRVLYKQHGDICREFSPLKNSESKTLATGTRTRLFRPMVCPSSISIELSKPSDNIHPTSRTLN